MVKNKKENLMGSVGKAKQTNKKTSEITSISFLHVFNPKVFLNIINFKCLHLFPIHTLLTFKLLTSTQL